MLWEFVGHWPAVRELEFLINVCLFEERKNLFLGESNLGKRCKLHLGMRFFIRSNKYDCGILLLIFNFGVKFQLRCPPSMSQIGCGTASLPWAARRFDTSRHYYPLGGGWGGGH